MITSGIAVPCLDPHANLTAAQRAAASKAGYGISYISPEAEYMAAQAARLASTANVEVAPEVK